jgi:CheY-like chemotaxis protein
MTDFKPRADAAVQAGELRGARVLVVDDDEDNREMLVVVLEHGGAVVTTAASAAEALRAVQSGEQPQVVVTDLRLQGEDGFSLLDGIRALPPSRGGAIPLIALTGYGGVEESARSLERGFHAHLTKPVDFPELLRAVGEALVLAERKNATQ